MNSTPGGATPTDSERSRAEVAATERLRIRRLDAGDVAFLFRLVNEPSWIRYIGEKGVRSVEDARRYLEQGPLAMYGRLGFGLYAVELRATREPIGICGLIRRDALPDVDLGFALLPEYWRSGYAFEAATAVMAHGRTAFGLRRIVAVLSRDNDRSRRLLVRLGFRFERRIRLSPEDEELDLYATTV
jgi:RimJ/RimL family protein N-acetyltransferase